MEPDRDCAGIGIGGRDAFLDIWLDLNNDGDWDEVSEQIVTSNVVNTGQTLTLVNGPNTFNVNIPGGTSPGALNARVRLSSTAV